CAGWRSTGERKAASWPPTGGASISCRRPPHRPRRSARRKGPGPCLRRAAGLAAGAAAIDAGRHRRARPPRDAGRHRGALMARLSEPQIGERLKQLAGWERSGTRIRKTYRFSSFKEGVAFANRVAELAEEQDH